ncbi:class II aldolase/adducin family protein [Labrys wisconsinensis]|uniref:Rhamnose utilization protein RhaD (Predicted bifunctional aldolase and dehydrogenase) n=1 Tax=Labrys wisconsinensis TaxID=425677 RepID=A0ABU0JBQ6_9HYPH|nr:class II aldolase/adducin family protein [Labrys wisconsinensis]MDQ0471715.1 rhamnose utilization protein RhaD (predicted bifunctional aldolase and dehydrogenase) [Labrys wisconsinensis]
MSELDRLLALSARIGADPALVQGAGGNTSIKQDGVLTIKASGAWLAHALEKPIMVPVRLDPLLRAVERDDPASETSVDFVVAEANPQGLRPSIETTMHAVLPQRIVVHVHCVETIAWAVRWDAKAALSQELAGFDWAFVPYARPGRPLTRAILAALRPGVSVLVLGNHGLVVAGETVDEAQALLAAVSARLRRPVRKAPPSDPAALERAAAGSRYRPAADPATHAAATDPASFLLATSGSLYPDHVIFLGPAAVPLPPGAAPDAMAALAGRPALPMLLAEGAGVLLHEAATPGAAALARCLADVAARIDPRARLRQLSPAEEDALTNWDAEKYRQALDRKAP